MSLRRDPLIPRGRVAAALGIVLLAGLTGCTAVAPAPTPKPTAVATPGASPAATPTEAPAAPALVPDGTAAENLPYFAAIAQQVAASEHKAEGRAYIDALVAAGFDKGTMQVTQDQSTVGNAAEALQFSVLWKGECLVGQVGPEVQGAVARVLPALQGGTVCLVGLTRPIDW